MIAALPVAQSGRRLRSPRCFGWRVNPWPEFHQGVDLAADYGTPVHAAADGVVDRPAGTADSASRSTSTTRTATTPGTRTFRASPSRSASTSVRARISPFVGATGEATGPHLHYQVMLNGERDRSRCRISNGVPAKVLGDTSRRRGAYSMRDVRTLPHRRVSCSSVYMLAHAGLCSRLLGTEPARTVDRTTSRWWSSRCWRPCAESSRRWAASISRFWSSSCSIQLVADQQLDRPAPASSDD